MRNMESTHVAPSTYGVIPVNKTHAAALSPGAPAKKEGGIPAQQQRQSHPPPATLSRSHTLPGMLLKSVYLFFFLSLSLPFQYPFLIEKICFYFNVHGPHNPQSLILPLYSSRSSFRSAHGRSTTEESTLTTRT